MIELFFFFNKGCRQVFLAYACLFLVSAIFFVDDYQLLSSL